MEQFGCILEGLPRLYGDNANSHYECGASPERGCVRRTSRSAVKRLKRKSNSTRFRKFGRAAAGARRTQPRSRNARASHNENCCVGHAAIRSFHTKIVSSREG